MAGYILHNNMGGTTQAVTTTYITLTRAVTPGSNPKRIRVVELEVSAISAPSGTDCQIEADFSYCSSAGTGTSTAVTPQPMDSGVAIGTPADVAITAGAANFTAEPTTYNLAQSWFHRGFNQRSGVLWQAIPGHEIIQPATASIGAGIRVLSTNYTGKAIGKMVFDEL